MCDILATKARMDKAKAGAEAATNPHLGLLNIPVSGRLGGRQAWAMPLRNNYGQNPFGGLEPQGVPVSISSSM